ncbi:MAG: class I SAM-dependent methyltransferase [Chloroflexi bacterium]|jgi:hypothetical protein|nr:class I SAM-dependent methyltransferase [Chloroflexota bacterium]
MVSLRAVTFCVPLPTLANGWLWETIKARMPLIAHSDQMLPLIETLIRYQYAANAGLPLAEFERANVEGYRVHPDLLRLFVDRREGVLAVLESELNDVHRSSREGLVRLFVTSTQTYLHRNNQFITLSKQDREALNIIYTAYLEEMVRMVTEERDEAEVAQLLYQTVDAHLHRLQAFVARLGAAHSEGGTSLLDASVVCEEYPVPLQLDVLGLGPDQLREPILDVGCGSRGLLVAHLRALGLEAYGIDRQIEPAEGLYEADWLEYPLAPSTWGTILSHMAFSNHFLFHHLYKRGTPEAYARRYMELLRGLQVGGMLLYTPGLPFIERLLPPDEFQVERHNVPAARQSPIHAAYGRILGNANGLGGGVLYAARVVRRA